MANIFDYLKGVAHDSFYDFPLNELDILALTEITYLSFDNLVSTSPQRLLDLAPQVPREPNMLTSENRLQLLDELAQHKRFKNCKLSHFINDIDPELQKQFAAMTYRLTLDTYLIVFRGTDDSIIGWKEDFHMTYMKEIPAHQIIVQSTALGGIAQHDTFSWQIKDKHFVQLDKTNSDSQQVDTTFKEWVATVPDEELQLYFDLFFGTILDSGITSINDLSSFKALEHIHHLFIQAQSLTPEERETMGRLTQLLIDTRYQAWKNR